MSWPRITLFESPDFVARLDRDGDGDVIISLARKKEGVDLFLVIASDNPLFPAWQAVFNAMNADNENDDLLTDAVAAERHHDMGVSAKLVLEFYEDGLHVSVADADDPNWPSAEFTNSGGHSEKTYDALCALYNKALALQPA